MSRCRSIKFQHFRLALNHNQLAQAVEYLELTHHLQLALDSKQLHSTIQWLLMVLWFKYFQSSNPTGSKTPTPSFIQLTNSVVDSIRPMKYRQSSISCRSEEPITDQCRIFTPQLSTSKSQQKILVPETKV